MKTNIQSVFKKSVIAIAMSMALGSVVALANKGSIDMGSASLSYTSSGSNLTLLVAGSGMDVITVYGTSSINWNLPTDIADGTYRYELIAVTPATDGKEESAQTERLNGNFKVINGLILQQAIETEETKLDEEQSAIKSSMLEKMAIAAIDFLVPVTQAADLTASSTVPWITFDDSQHADSNDWRLSGNRYNNNTFGEFILWDYLGANNNIVMKIKGNSGSTNNRDSLIVEESGDMNFASNSFFIDRSANKVGIGTTTPIQELSIVSLDPTIVLHDTHGTQWLLNNNPNSDIFDIAHQVGANAIVSPFIVKHSAQANTLQVLGSGVNIAGNSNSNTLKLGIGTESPENAIHIKRNSANIKIEDNSAATAKRFQIQMRNNGGTGFKMTDTSAVGREWQFATLSNGSFTASYLGTGGSELQILNDGRVTMGPGATTNFNLLPGGNLYINHGSVTAVNFITSSSHTVKKDFEKVNGDELMNKLQNLEVTKWRYKDPEVKGHHIGPMAEDFYKLFELGPDNKHVVATDMAGIALIAAKKLQEKTNLTKAATVALKQQFEEKTSALKAENEKLHKRLASLEKLVTTLASSTKGLDSSGDKVALK